MRYAELIQLFFERSNALQWYWTLYVVVIGGLLAFSSLRQRPDAVTGILVTVLFACFAYKNLGAIHDVTFQRYAAARAISEFPTTGAEVPDTIRKALETTLVVPAWPGVRNFHVASDLLTIAALWAMELRRVRLARTAAAAPPQGKS